MLVSLLIPFGIANKTNWEGVEISNFTERNHARTKFAVAVSISFCNHRARFTKKVAVDKHSHIGLVTHKTKASLSHWFIPRFVAVVPFRCDIASKQDL
jgi:hypothetical protein